MPERGFERKVKKDEVGCFSIDDIFKLCMWIVIIKIRYYL